MAQRLIERSFQASRAGISTNSRQAGKHNNCRSTLNPRTSIRPAASNALSVDRLKDTFPTSNNNKSRAIRGRLVHCRRKRLLGACSSRFEAKPARQKKRRRTEVPVRKTRHLKGASQRSALPACLFFALPVSFHTPMSKRQMTTHLISCGSLAPSPSPVLRG